MRVKSIPPPATVCRRIAVFWSKVEKSPGCWLWVGTSRWNGYGVSPKPTGGSTSAHRVAWEITHGPIPEGLYVCHHCDNPRCVNPAHLFLGTAQENTDDARRKGRIPHKGRRGGHKLTAEQVTAMRRAYANGEGTQRQIAARFGISEAMIGLILRWKSWRHLPFE